MFVALFYAILALALLAPMSSDTTVPKSSDFAPHLGGIVQARMALEEGQFPPRVAPWQYQGWGYPEYQFYAPLPYTLAGLLHAWVSPSNPFVALKITLWLALTLGGFGIDRLARWLTGSGPAALLAGAMYMAAPYSLINVHVRGAFPEAVAQGILPMVLYSSLRCYARPGRLALLAAALAWFALATTHTITFVYGTFFIGLWLLCSGRSRKNLARLLRLGVAYAFAWLLAMYFLAPVVLFDGVRIRDHLDNPFSTNWYTTLPALLSPVAVAPWPRTERAGIVFDPAIGWPMLLGAGAALALLVTRPGLLRRRAGLRFAPPLLGIFGLALFMAWSPVDFWSLLPKPLYVTQFTFRFLTHVMWSGALLGAYALAAVFGRRLDARGVAIGLLAIGAAGISFLPTAELGTDPIDLRLLSRTPDLGYTSRDYLLKPQLFPDRAVVGDLELPAVQGAGWLVLDQPLDLPRLAQFRSSPVLLRVVGDVPPEVARDTLGLTLLLNQRPVTTVRLPAGPFRWEVPLQQPLEALARDAEGGDVQISFSADRVLPARPRGESGSIDTRRLAVRAQSVVVRGLPPDQTAMPVRQTERGCRRDRGETRCSLVVEPSTGLVQLPVLYYPGFLDVQVDGVSTPHEPLVYQDSFLTGVRVPPGSHEIRVRFEGLVWANQVSGTAWLVAVFLLGCSFIRPRPLARLLHAGLVRAAGKAPPRPL